MASPDHEDMAHIAIALEGALRLQGSCVYWRRVVEDGIERLAYKCSLCEGTHVSDNPDRRLVLHTWSCPLGALLAGVGLSVTRMDAPVLQEESQ